MNVIFILKRALFTAIVEYTKYLLLKMISKTLSELRCNNEVRTT